MSDSGTFERILGRIRALRERTVSNGCTEAEAIAASEMIATLLAKYKLTLEDVTDPKVKYERRDRDYRSYCAEVIFKVANAIAKLTHTSTWVSPTGVYPVTMTFFGISHEVEIASYLCEICYNAMRTYEASFIKRHPFIRPSTRARMVRPHINGMADRLAQRIREMAKSQTTGKELMVIREDQIEQQMLQQGIKTKRSRPAISMTAFSGYDDGKAAADKVALSAAIRQQQRHNRLNNDH